MPDCATPNLPSRDFAVTKRFYAALGFECGYKDEGWMMLHRGPKGARAILEFFPHPQLDPAESWFSACIRFDDLAGFMELVAASGIPECPTGFPRYHAATTEPSGLAIAYLVDPDGSLIRLIQHD